MKHITEALQTQLARMKSILNMPLEQRFLHTFSVFFTFCILTQTVGSKKFGPDTDFVLFSLFLWFTYIYCLLVWQVI